MAEFRVRTVDFLIKALEYYKRTLEVFLENEEVFPLREDEVIERLCYEPLYVDIRGELEEIEWLLTEFEPGERYRFERLTSKRIEVMIAALKQYEGELQKLKEKCSKHFKQKIPFSTLEFKEIDKEIREAERILTKVEPFKSEEKASL